MPPESPSVSRAPNLSNGRRPGIGICGFSPFCPLVQPSHDRSTSIKGGWQRPGTCWTRKVPLPEETVHGPCSRRTPRPLRNPLALGAGGMGEVYQARDTRLDRKVAVKVLAPELASDAEFRARFAREAKAISALNHPHICGLYDIGREHDTDYLVLELLEGETLAARLARGPLPLARSSASASKSRTPSSRHTGTASSTET